MYAKKIDKFMVRHFIKPGITGLAQTNGYRGEVENDKDIINRVKYDIFYLVLCIYYYVLVNTHSVLWYLLLVVVIVVSDYAVIGISLFLIRRACHLL